MRNNKIIPTLFALFLLIIVGYTAYTARHIIQGPQISFVFKERVLSTSSEFFDIAGTVTNTTELRINTQKILLDEYGAFTNSVLLSPGENRFILTVQDKFGREKKETVIIFSTPEEEIVL